MRTLSFSNQNVEKKKAQINPTKYVHRKCKSNLYSLLNIKILFLFLFVANISVLFETFSQGEHFFNFEMKYYCIFNTKDAYLNFLTSISHVKQVTYECCTIKYLKNRKG